MSKVTVQSIADELGLSKFAVSRALNGKSGVGEETRKLVVEAAEKLGYRPRSARGNAPGPIRVLIRSAAVGKRELWMDVRNGLEIEAMRQSVELEFAFTDSAAEVQQFSQNAAAFIIVGPCSRDVYEAVEASGLPTIALSHILPPLMEIDQVMSTDEESGEAVGEFLLSKGHRKFIYVHGQKGYPGRDLRLRGFQTSIKDVEDAEIREIAFTEDYSPTGFVSSIRTMIADGFVPTAFFCGSDGVAVTVLSELHRLGLKVPTDCSVVGHADYPLATQVTPNLTTIHIPHRQLGIEAMRLLSMRMAETKSNFLKSPVRIYLLASLVERDSTSEAGKPDWDAALKAAQS